MTARELLHALRTLPGGLHDIDALPTIERALLLVAQDAKIETWKKARELLRATVDGELKRRVREPQG